MSITKKLQIRRKKRAQRTRAHQDQRGKKLRVSVFRSARHIYAQIIDDAASHTIVQCSSRELGSVSGDKKAVAHQVGVALAKKARDKSIDTVFFDRGQFVYHGRIASLADGLREGGLSL